MQTNTLPDGYRIQEITKHGQTKFIVEKRFFGFIWITVRKQCLDIHTKDTLRYFRPDHRTQFSDRNSRQYSIVTSDGNCRTYQEALEFAAYEPNQIHMRNDNNDRVIRMWANNHIANNALGAFCGDCRVSRIGLFYGWTDADFQLANEYWEDYFVARHGFSKVA